MVTRRTLLFYNFGIGMIFVIIGAISLVMFDQFLFRPAIVPPFDRASAEAIKAEPDVEKLRNQALFYFGLGRDLKRARYSDTDTLVRDFRYLCFLLGGIFLVGGIMAIAATRKLPGR